MLEKLIVLIVVSCFIVVRVNGLPTDIVEADTPKNKVVGCYYQSYAIGRSSIGKFSSSNLDPSLCTHMYYAFAGIRADTANVTVNENVDIKQDGYLNFTSLKSIYPDTKFILTIGGWSAGSQNFSTVVASRTLRRTFIENVLELMQRYNFDGIDFDWEYPSTRNGSSDDVQNFAELLREFRKSFDEYGYLLSAAVVTGSYGIDIYYNVSALNEYLDYINVMTYNFHTSSESKTGINSPLYDPKSRLSCNYSIHTWIDAGVSPQKLVLGIPSYGRSFTLTDPDNNGIGAPTSGPGKSGPYLKGSGSLAYYEILAEIDAPNSTWTVVWSDEQKAPYAYSGDQWVGYDNVESVIYKVQFAKELDIGGVMTWSIDLDDFNGEFGESWPLLTAMNTIHEDM